MGCHIQARPHMRGGMRKLADALIAGTAMANDVAVATRNVKDFAGPDIDTLNPWDAP